MDSWLEERIRRLEDRTALLRGRAGEVERRRRASTQDLFYMGQQQTPSWPPTIQVTLTWNTGANTATHTSYFNNPPGPSYSPFYATDILGTDATKWWDSHMTTGRSIILIADTADDTGRYAYEPGSGTVSAGVPSVNSSYGTKFAIPFPTIISLTYAPFGTVTINAV